MKIGDKYNWKNQPERLVYIGKKGSWHQFSKVEYPEVVWCEVLDSDLGMLEKTEDKPLEECPNCHQESLIVVGGGHGCMMCSHTFSYTQ